MDGVWVWDSWVCIGECEYRAMLGLRVGVWGGCGVCGEWWEGVGFVDGFVGVGFVWDHHIPAPPHLPSAALAAAASWAICTA